MPKTYGNKITPELVGQYLGMSAQSVRVAMESGRLNIGQVYITDSGIKKFVITPKTLYDGTGIKLNGYEPPPTVNIDYEELAKRIVSQFMDTIAGGKGDKG